MTALTPAAAREVELPPHAIGRADQIGHVERPPAGLARRVLDRAQAGLDPRLEGAERVIGEPVIVLDHVDARPGERAAQRRELGRLEPHRLERGGQQRPAATPVIAPQAREAGARPGKPVERGVRQLDVGQAHVGLEGGIAEQHVEQLGGVAGGGGEGVRDGDAVEVPPAGADLRHAAEDVVGDPGIARRDVAGELDRLLEQQCLGTLGHVPGGGADEIRDVEAGVAGCAPHG